MTRATDTNTIGEQIAFDKVFCAGWIVPEWNSIREFKRDYKPARVEIADAGSARCDELMAHFRNQPWGKR